MLRSGSGMGWVKWGVIQIVGLNVDLSHKGKNSSHPFL